MKRTTKAISIILSLIMVMGIFAAAPISAGAKDKEPHSIYVVRGSAVDVSTGEKVTTACEGDRLRLVADKMEDFTIFESFYAYEDDITIDESDWTFTMPDRDISIGMNYYYSSPLNIDLSEGVCDISKNTYDYLLSLIKKGQIYGYSRNNSTTDYIITFADDCDVLLTPGQVAMYDYEYAPSYSYKLVGNYELNPVNFIFAKKEIYTNQADLTIPAVGSSWDYDTMQAKITLKGDLASGKSCKVTKAIWYNAWGLSNFSTFEGNEKYFVELELMPINDHYFTLNSQLVLNADGYRTLYLKPLAMNADGSVRYGNGTDQYRFVGGTPHSINVNNGFATLDPSDTAITKAVPGQFVYLQVDPDSVDDGEYVVMGTVNGDSDDVDVFQSEMIDVCYFYMPNNDVNINMIFETDDQIDSVLKLYNSTVTIPGDGTQKSEAFGVSNVLRLKSKKIEYVDDETFYDIDGNGSRDIKLTGRNQYSLLPTNSLKENVKLNTTHEETLHYPVRSVELQVNEPVKHKITINGGVASSKRGDFANNYVITEACEGESVYVFPKTSALGDDYYMAQTSFEATSDDVTIYDDAGISFVMPNKDVTVNYSCDCLPQQTSVMDFRYNKTVTVASDGTGARSEAYGVSMLIRLSAKSTKEVSDYVYRYDLDGDGTYDIEQDRDSNSYTLLSTNSLPLNGTTITLSREDSWTLPIRSLTIQKQLDPPKRGDTNFDGKINIDDATFLQRHLAGYRNPNNGPLIDETDPDSFHRADANNDNKISINDVTEIQRHIAGLKQLMP